MKKLTIVLNWIAVIWTILGVFAMFDGSPVDPWAFLYLVVIIAAQAMALSQLK